MDLFTALANFANDVLMEYPEFQIIGSLIILVFTLIFVWNFFFWVLQLIRGK